MILGGVNGAGRAGGMRAGRSETYLPCFANVINSAIQTAIEQTTASVNTWRASARIRSVDGLSWIDLGSASYFQISRDSEGNLDTADVTLQQPEVWSPWLATYPDLLKPSNRRLQIRAGMVISGTWYPVVVFTGTINDISEAIGANGGGISIRLQDARDQMTRTNATPLSLTSATTFRAMLAQQATLTAINDSFVTIRVAFKDTIITGISSNAQSGDTLQAIISQLPGLPLLQISGSGSLKLAQETTAETKIAQFAYSDRNIHVATRRYSGDASVNVVRVYGLVGGVGTAGEVQDDDDVAVRGRIVYPAGFIGSPTMQYTDAEQMGREHIAASLRGIIDLEIPFNPYLVSGSIISLSSSRLGITSANAKIYKIRHQYSVGRCRTYLNGMRFY